MFFFALLGLYTLPIIDDDIDYTSRINDYVSSTAFLAERVIRTLKRSIRAYMTDKNTHKYEASLQLFVDTYNLTKHRSIGMAPADVTPDNVACAKYNRPLQDWERQVPDKSREPLHVGDLVRLSGSSKPFANRELNHVWTETLFVIQKVK